MQEHRSLIRYKKRGNKNFTLLHYRSKIIIGFDCILRELLFNVFLEILKKSLRMFDTPKTEKLLTQIRLRDLFFSFISRTQPVAVVKLPKLKRMLDVHGGDAELEHLQFGADLALQRLRASG